VSQDKVSLFAMADAVGEHAFFARGHLDRWARDNPGQTLPADHPWIVEARTIQAAHLTLSLMALDEDGSRKFVSSIFTAKPAEAGMLMAMLAPRKPTPEPSRDESA
jgi:hypothetical protein